MFVLGNCSVSYGPRAVKGLEFLDFQIGWEGHCSGWLPRDLCLWSSRRRLATVMWNPCPILCFLSMIR